MFFYEVKTLFEMSPARTSQTTPLHNPGVTTLITDNQ